MQTKLTGDIMEAANRYEVLLKVQNGILTNRECSQILGLSLRHVIRLGKKLKEGNGLSSLVKEKTGPKIKSENNDESKEIIKLRKWHYPNHNICHFKDVLLRDHNIKRSYEFLRKLLIKEKLHEVKKTRVAKRKHRQRFEAPEAGLLVQRDTSIHLWVPYLKKHLKLIVDLDDHSRKITGSYLSERDDVLSNMFVTQETVVTHGVPRAYYMDNNAIYNTTRHLKSQPKSFKFFRYSHVNRDEKETLPQFKRALLDMGIKCIHSTPYQPQGKGKIERLFHFIQGRLVNEMEVANVRTVDEANEVLRKWVLWYNHSHVHRITKMIPNQRYMQKDSFLKWDKQKSLTDILSLRYQRTVGSDNTISLFNKIYQIKPNKYRVSYAKTKVDVRITLNGELKIFYEKKCIGIFPYKYNDSNELKYGAT